MNIKENLLYPIFKGLSASVLVFLFGFLSMYIYWQTYINTELPSNAVDLPGFISYRAATWGDGVFLPILIGSMITYISKSKQLTSQQSKPCYFIGLLGTIIGMSVQTSWVISKSTPLNWTIPSPHTFNAAGVHHAIFFSVMFGAISLLLSQIWLIRRKKQHCEDLLSKLCYTLIWFASSGFLFMFALDDYGGVNDILLLTLFLVGVLIVSIVITTTSSNQKNDVACVLSGILSSYSIAVISLNSANHLSLFTLAFAIVTSAYISPNDKPTFCIYKYILIAVPSTLLFFGFSSLIAYNAWWVNVLASLVISAVSFVIAILINSNHNKNSHLKSVFRLTCSFALLLSLSLVAYFFTNSNSLVEFILGVLMTVTVGKSAKLLIDLNFTNVKLAEKELNRLAIKREKYKKIKAMTYSLSFMQGLGVISFMFVVFWIIIQPYNLNNDKFFIISRFNQWYILAVAIFAAVLLVLLSRKNRDNSVRGTLLTITLLVSAYASLTAIILLSKTPYFWGFKAFSLISLPIYFLIFMLPGAAIMLSKGFLSNTVYIVGEKKDSLSSATSVTLFCGTISTTALIVFPSVDGDKAKIYSVFYRKHYIDLA